MLDRTKAYVSESRNRDDYGRSVLTVAIYHPDYRGVYVRGVVVTMPKNFRMLHPSEAYLVNNWQKKAREGVSYHAKRAEAIAHLKEGLFQALEKIGDQQSVERQQMLDLGELLNRARQMANACKETESDVYQDVSLAVHKLALKLTGDAKRAEKVYQSLLDGNGFKTAVRLEQADHEALMEPLKSLT